ncbi:MAG TPA: RNA polymerase sporulation sigma factor SigH [Actinomycetota bacterium]|nr:RNA polymerase sporulation sigma factor SigH [Actinomycetota bacterium]
MTPSQPAVVVHLQDDTTDEELVARYQAGEAEAAEELLERYRDFTRMKCRSYFLAGADRDDTVQEGMIGLYKAIRDYDPDRERSFKTFADLCITRQVISAIKTARRNKHTPLNSYVSISGSVGGEEDESMPLELLGTSPDPGDLVVSREEVGAIRMAFSEVLSDFEADVLHLYVEGKSYQEIGELLGRAPKAVDNAVQRIRKKVELHLASRDEVHAQG